MDFNTFLCLCQEHCVLLSHFVTLSTGLKPSWVKFIQISFSVGFLCASSVSPPSHDRGLCCVSFPKRLGFQVFELFALLNCLLNFSKEFKKMKIKACILVRVCEEREMRLVRRVIEQNKICKLSCFVCSLLCPLIIIIIICSCACDRSVLSLKQEVPLRFRWQNPAHDKNR